MGDQRWWLYQAGKWEDADSPLSENDKWPPEGWYAADHWYDLQSSIVEIWSTPGERWCVIVCLDTCEMYYVIVPRFPDLIELLAKLAPIALIAQTSMERYEKTLPT